MEEDLGNNRHRTTPGDTYGLGVGGLLRVGVAVGARVGRTVGLGVGFGVGYFGYL